MSRSAATRARLNADHDRERWVAFLRAQPLPLDVSADRAKDARTPPQNRYLFGVAYPPIAEATGWEIGGDGRSGGLHEYCCGEFFGWVDKAVPPSPRNPTGIESVPFRTTTRDENGKRDVIEGRAFSDFIERVCQIAAEAGVFIGQSWEEFERDMRTGEIRATGRRRGAVAR